MRLRRRAPGTASRRRCSDAEHAVLKALRAEMLGRRGEDEVRAAIEQSNLPALHDLMLPRGASHTAQIDHLVATRAGLLVVETKRLSGRIVGHNQDDHWRQVFAGEPEDAPPRRIYSPLRQNAVHCAAVYEAVRDIEADIFVHSRVVMTGVAEIAPQLAPFVLTLAAFTAELHSAHAPQPDAATARALRRVAALAARYDGRRSGTMVSGSG
ncbi:nuclease-related domain-containing protein [Kozakia baliensis]|uniref:nuclease-related domain-containing protein n=2 Tax=Kozakia baliensis TaxID=153496 RepID=UPI00068F76B4|nr:nuclease-related domain-containing protein [Kozakia baliensis]